MAPISKAFVKAIEVYAKTQEVPLITFERKARKDDVAAGYRRQFNKTEGVVFMAPQRATFGKAQEKAKLFRTEKRKHPESGLTYPWIVPSTGLVNYYYFYCQDED